MDYHLTSHRAAHHRSPLKSPFVPSAFTPRLKCLKRVSHIHVHIQSLRPSRLRWLGAQIHQVRRHRVQYSVVQRVVVVHRVCTGHRDGTGSRWRCKAVQRLQSRVWCEEHSWARGRVIRRSRRRFVVVRAPQNSFISIHGRSQWVVTVAVLVVFPMKRKIHNLMNHICMST